MNHNLGAQARLLGQGPLGGFRGLRPMPPTPDPDPDPDSDPIPRPHTQNLRPKPRPTQTPTPTQTHEHTTTPHTHKQTHTHTDTHTHTRTHTHTSSHACAHALISEPVVLKKPGGTQTSGSLLLRKPWELRYPCLFSWGSLADLKRASLYLR